MIDHLHSTWGIKPEHITGGEFTGYEPVFEQLDSFDKVQYDADPTGTIDQVFNIYRSIGLVPIVYYTHQGLIDAVRAFSKLSYNNVNSVSYTHLTLPTNREV